MRSVEERLRELEDIEAIRKLKFTYARLCDQQDADGVGALYTEDAVFDAGDQFGRYDGRKAVHDMLASNWQTMTWAIHLMTSPEIEVSPSGEEATGRWYLWEPATISGRPLWMVGGYSDRYKKIDGKWLISHCELRFEFMTPFESGWVKERFVT